MYRDKRIETSKHTLRDHSVYRSCHINMLQAANSITHEMTAYHVDQSNAPMEQLISFGLVSTLLKITITSPLVSHFHQPNNE